MKSGREGGCSPDRRANPVDVRRFYCGDKKLVFMVWPIEIQFTTRVAALPATGNRQGEAASKRNTRYFYGTFLVSRLNLDWGKSLGHTWSAAINGDR